MNVELANILTACGTLREAEKEINKKFFLFRGKEKRELEENRRLIIEKIKSLENDEWNLKYIVNLQHTLLTFWDHIAQPLFNNDVSIPGYNPGDEIDPAKFYTMYFKDEKDDEHHKLILLDLISDNINFSVFDPTTGNTLTVTSVNEVQASQKKIEMLCKKLIINGLIEYACKDD